VHPDHVRVELLTHRNDPLHEGRSDLTSKQTDAVEEGAEGKRVEGTRQRSRFQRLLREPTHQSNER